MGYVHHHVYVQFCSILYGPISRPQLSRINVTYNSFEVMVMSRLVFMVIFYGNDKISTDLVNKMMDIDNIDENI